MGEHITRADRTVTTGKLALEAGLSPSHERASHLKMKSMHPSFDEVNSRVDQLISDASTVARLIAAIMPIFPIQKFDRPGPIPKLARLSPKGLLEHNLEQDQGVFKCLHCLKLFQGAQGDLPLLGCTGTPNALRHLMRPELQHRISCVRVRDPPRSLYFCTECGAWAEKRCVNLAQKCSGPAPLGSAGHAALNKIREGRNPPVPQIQCTQGGFQA
jgi:hypothetical protein